MNHNEVIEFWFSELSAKDWWKKDVTLDKKIRERFYSVHRAAVAGELSGWRESDKGRLAEIIVIDQFSRNMFRDSAESFAYDGIAVVLSQEAITAKADRSLNSTQKAFMYMPLMHSESQFVHEQAMKIFDQPGLESNLDFEKKHKVIIDRFGRYPHRNKVLGRESTKEELEFLSQPGSSF